MFSPKVFIPNLTLFNPSSLYRDAYDRELRRRRGRWTTALIIRKVKNDFPTRAGSTLIIWTQQSTSWPPLWLFFFLALLLIDTSTHSWWNLQPKITMAIVLASIDTWRRTSRISRIGTRTLQSHHTNGYPFRRSYQSFTLCSWPIAAYQWKVLGSKKNHTGRFVCIITMDGMIMKIFFSEIFLDSTYFSK